MDNKTIAAIIAVAAITSVAAVLIAYSTIRSHGRIVGFGVDNSIDEIDWGVLSPGETAQVGFTVTNTGGKSGILNLTAPGIPSFLMISWNSEGASLQPGEQRFVQVTLEAASNAQPQDFNFDIIITLKGT